MNIGSSKEINNIKDSSNFILKQTSNLSEIFKRNPTQSKETTPTNVNSIPSKSPLEVVNINKINEKSVSKDKNRNKVDSSENQAENLALKAKSIRNSENQKNNVSFILRPIVKL